MRILQCKGGAIGTADVRDVADALSRGKLVVYPTDTLYGLGADPYDRVAVRALYAAKGKPTKDPVSVMVADAKRLEEIADVPALARDVVAQHLPGPLTVILPPGPQCPPAPVASDDGIGVRIPDDPIARAVAERYGPVTCTSANVHGKPPPREVYEAVAQLGELVEVYVDSGPSPTGTPSTVVDFTGDRCKVLREGALSAEELGLDES